ncbi:hypothetical protein MKZ38_009414 [Zalerion maritima]|uniref:DUF300-domain-containing protein n=1 Tax=Zalerion maritima TaxID=339359 RepID=A0AAD5WTI8_9PEZI|nr:hypothetical protein MKZ38_009414 [Zalerion maritima]
MGFNLTCNSTLEDMRITSETAIVGSLTFHELALIIGGACTIIAILLSFYLMWMHALNYTKPREQRQYVWTHPDPALPPSPITMIQVAIIRILLMVPVYASSSFLQIYYYYHAVYFLVISDCYEAFAIASFFTLMCHYIAPDLHEQKNFFRNMHPVEPWVWPLGWFAKCCGGQRGIWRTPKSGLTWFNIVWIGIYHYCFIRVAMTVTAVLTQSFDRYCESSNSPVFAHIWVLTINSLAVTVAMYCVIQFYVQLREALAEHKPFLKVLAIKLVIFLAFWQSMAISVGTSTLEIVHATDTVAYPDLKVGIPALLICVEMSLFALMHLWAFPYQPYRSGAPKTYYPVPDPSSPGAPSPRENMHSAPAGGPLGLSAFVDALNVWDVAKAFGRGMRWLFCGVKRRKEDPSYQHTKDGMELGKTSMDNGYGYGPGQKSTDHLPIAQQFRRSTFGIPGSGSGYPSGSNSRRYQQQQMEAQGGGEESAGLIAHAQSSPSGGNPLTVASAGEGRQWGAAAQASSGYSSPAPGVIPQSPYEESGMGAYREEQLDDKTPRERRYDEAQRRQHEQRQQYQPQPQFDGEPHALQYPPQSQQQYPQRPYDVEDEDMVLPRQAFPNPAHFQGQQQQQQQQEHHQGRRIAGDPRQMRLPPKPRREPAQDETGETL